MNGKLNLFSKKPRVVLISSTRAVFNPMQEAFKAGFPTAEIIHLLDETLLDDFRRDGGISPRSRRKALQMALTAQEAGVDGILVTCSTLSPSVDDFRPFIAIPVVKIDEPVVEKVVQSADEIGLLATAETVLKSVEPLILRKARQLGRKISIQRFIKGDLWPLLQSDPSAFYREIGEAASRAARECHSVILTQVSIAPGREYVEKEFRERVYASPTYAVQALRQILSNSESTT